MATDRHWYKNEGFKTCPHHYTTVSVFVDWNGRHWILQLDLILLSRWTLSRTSIYSCSCFTEVRLDDKSRIISSNFLLSAETYGMLAINKMPDTEACSRNNNCFGFEMMWCHWNRTFFARPVDRVLGIDIPSWFALASWGLDEDEPPALLSIVNMTTFGVIVDILFEKQKL